LRTKPRKAGEFKRQGKKVEPHEHSSRKEWETLQLDKSFAERFAAEWIELWNARDVNRVLAHSRLRSALRMAGAYWA
jgi:hypothetical protein